MGFKKLTLDEINSAKYASLIGAPIITEEHETEKAHNIFQTETLGDKLSLHETKPNKIINENSIQITFEENSTYQIDSKSNLKETTTESWVYMKNPSASDKIWNLELKIADSDQVFKISELNPLTSWQEKLTSKEIEKKVPLSIMERISRINFPNTPEFSSETYLDTTEGNVLFISVFAKNETEDEFNIIEIVKDLPSSLIKVLNIDCTQGSTILDKSHINWKIDKLAKHESAILHFKIQITSKKTKFGAIHAIFDIKKLKEFINPVKDLIGFGKIGQFLNITQRDEAPEVWDCSLSVVSRTDLLFKIKKATLSEEVDDELIILKSEDFDKLLKPFEEVELLHAINESKFRPNLSKNIDIIPVYSYNESNKCRIEIEEQSLELLSITAQKNFSVSEIQSFIAANFDATITVNNFSSIALNQLLFLEMLPAEFTVTELAGITVQLGDTSVRLGDYQKESIHLNPHEELADLIHNIDAINQNYEQSTMEFDAISSQLNELDVEQIDTDKKDLIESSNQITDEIKQLNKDQSESTKNLQSFEDQVQEQAKKQEESQTNLNSLLELKSILEKISQKNKEIKNQKETLKTVSAQKETLDSQLATLQSAETGSEFQEDGTATPENKKKADIEKKLALVDNHITEIQEKITSLESGLAELQEKNPNNETLANLTTQIDLQQKELKGIETALKDLNDNKSQKELEKESVSTTIQGKTEELEQIRAQIAHCDELLKTRKELQEKSESYHASISSLNEKREGMLQRKAKLENVTSTDKNLDQIREFLSKDFEGQIKDEVHSSFEVFVIPIASQGNLLSIQLNNMKEIVGILEPDNTLTLQYTIHTDRPQNNRDYVFPTTIFYDTIPSQIMQKYEISSAKLPKIEVIHQRHKISLGKLIDHAKEAGKYAVSLLIRNNGNISVDKLQIIDTLPKEAEIFNAFYEYEEKIEDEIKQIIWHIDRLGAYQELEIDYIVDLHGQVSDLSEFEMSFKQVESES